MALMRPYLRNPMTGLQQRGNAIAFRMGAQPGVRPKSPATPGALGNWQLKPPPVMTSDPTRPVKAAPLPTPKTGNASTPSSRAPGLMGTAQPSLQFDPASIAPTTYDPTGYTAQSATSEGYTPQAGTVESYDPTNMQASSYTAGSYDPTKADRTGTTYDPTLQDVQRNQLVSNQLTALTADNSPYIQQARLQARQAAAQRGLMTSSIAVGNAQAAAIQAALPIAQGNAARYGSVADQDMAARNQAGQFNAGATLNANEFNANAANTAGQFNTGAQNAASQFNAANQQNASQFNAGAANTANQFNTNSANQMEAANVAAANQAAEFGANAQNAVNQFNVNSANQAAFNNANVRNQAGQFNVGQINNANQFNAAQDNSARLAQLQAQEGQYEFDRNTDTQQANQYFGSQYNRENTMTNVLSNIYGNPNLTPDQQAQAAANAKTIIQGLWNATNATFAQGVPDVFLGT